MSNQTEVEKAERALDSQLREFGEFGTIEAEAVSIAISALIDAKIKQAKEKDSA